MKFYSSKHIITTSKPPGMTEGQKIVFKRVKNGFFTSQKLDFYIYTSKSNSREIT